MKILDRYTSKFVVRSICLMVIVITAIDLLFFSVNELRNVGRGDYTLNEAIIYILLSVPSKLYLMFPFAVLVGTLLALGNLQRTHELIAMQSLRYTPTLLLSAVLKSVTLMTLLIFLVGEFIAPPVDKYANRRKTIAISSGSAITTDFGTFLKVNDDFVRVGKVIADDKVENITIYRMNNNEGLDEIESAKMGSRIREVWTLTDIVKTHFKDTVTQDKLASVKYKNFLDVKILETATIRNLEKMSLFKLYGMIKVRMKSDLGVMEYWYALYIRLVKPLLPIVVVLIAFPFSFGEARSTSNGKKLLIGIMLGFSFYILNSMIGSLVLLQLKSPLIAAIIAPTVFLLVSLFRIYKLCYK